MHPATLPGFLATSPEALERALGDASGVTRHAVGGLELGLWGLDPGDVLGSSTAILSKVSRGAEGKVSRAHVEALLRSDPRTLTQLLPPFGVVGVTGDSITMAADSLGFQHLYHRHPASERPAMLASSALVAAGAGSGGWDHTAVAVQSLLGWQLDQRTLFGDIRKLEPGAVAIAGETGVRLHPAEPARRDQIALAEAVSEAAKLLRQSMTALLDDHPDAVLQLTGGMDSRLLLSAVPEKRRRGLHAMTLEVAGAGDVEVARTIARRYGLHHEVHGLGDVDKIDPAEAWQRCVSDSVRLDAMCDPVALAAQRIAEQSFTQGVRISGLGGEIARGFYYVGRVRERPFDARDAARLAAWRMFVNEAIEPGILTSEFADWARQAAEAQVHRALTASGEGDWFRASDELYIRHRMQRWAGATDTAVSNQRVVVNPMLDARFIQVARRLSPRDKAGARFLALLQMKLDPELGRLPLNGRPAPRSYANPSPLHPANEAARTARRLGKKSLQRLRGRAQPPAGGTVMASKVLEHWRANPDALQTLNRLDFIRSGLVEDLATGRARPGPSSVAFLTNLVVAASYLHPDRTSCGLAWPE